MEFKFSINNDRLMPEECISGVSGNVNTYICSFDIKCDYTGLTWFCVFKQGDTVYQQIIQNGVCIIPYEVLENKGIVYVGCYATNADEADLKRISTNWVSLFVGEGAYSEGSVPDVPTADAWEIYVNSKVEPLLEEIETAESQRQTAENNRLSAENNRNIAESNRQTAEDDRVTAESGRATAETQRLNAEANRKSNETDRISAETARVEAENARAEAEAQRALSESERQSAETERALAESARVEAETARVSAENARVEAEAARAEELAKKAEQVELERLNYYGDKDIIPTDESYFTVSGGTITGLTDAGRELSEIVIPYKINGVEIIGIESSFYNCTSLTSIIIPNSVTSIGPDTFSGCTALTSISIPNSVTSIGPSAFYNCTLLTSINIPNSVTSIGEGAFQHCTSLTSINIPNSVTTIEGYPFAYCISLTSINIPNSVTSIGTDAFSNCTSLTSINIPNSVISIWEGAFNGCTNLTIYCEQGSYAETYANTNNIPVMYTDISATEFDNKADKATTLEGYGITDAYTKTEADTKDSALKDDISDLKQKSIPHTTASGYPITVTDHLEGETVINYQVYGNSVQDGTPTPETPIEIQSVGNLVTDETSEYYGKYDVPVTVCGKNLFDMETILPEQGWVKQDDGSYYVANNATVRNKVLWENTENYTGQLKILFQAKYSVDNSRGSYLWVNYTDGTYLVVYYAGTVVANTWYYPESSRTITDSNKIVQNIVWTYGTGATSTWVKDIIITKDLTATEYEQYSGETKHIYLDAPLRKVGDYADYVDFQSQKTIRQVEVLDATGTTTIAESFGILATPTEESIIAPELTAPTSEVMNVSLGAATSPSNIDLTYYQDINKVITSLTNAILAQGGNV